MQDFFLQKVYSHVLNVDISLVKMETLEYFHRGIQGSMKVRCTDENSKSSSGFFFFFRARKSVL